MKGLGFKGRRATDVRAVLAGLVKRLLVPRAEWKGSCCFWGHILTLFTMTQLEKHQNLLSSLALSILAYIVPKKKLEVKIVYADKLKLPECH